MRLLIMLIVLTLSLVFTSTMSFAEVAIYAKRTGGGENIYETEYGRSGDWHISCSTQVRGPAVGRRWCSIEPMNKQQYTHDNFFDTGTSGVNVKIWRDRDADLAAGAENSFAVIDFIPARTLSPKSEYEVVCGEYSVRGLASGERNGAHAFSGPQARALLSAMTSAETCVMDYVSENSVRNNQTMSVYGLDAVLSHAARFTGDGR